MIYFKEGNQIHIKGINYIVDNIMLDTTMSRSRLGSRNQERAWVHLKFKDVKEYILYTLSGREPLNQHLIDKSAEGEILLELSSGVYKVRMAMIIYWESEHFQVRAEEDRLSIFLSYWKHDNEQ